MKVIFVLLCVVLWKVRHVLCQNLTVEEFEERNGCKCVMYYLCTSDNFIITDGSQIIDIRAGVPIERKECPSRSKNIEWCCKLKGDTQVPVTPKSNPDATTSSPPPVTKNPNEPDIVTVIHNVTCGIQRPRIDVRFQNTDMSTALDGEFPWAAAIYKKNKFKCTGSLIHPRVVLTVAHYVTSSQKSDLKVVVNGKTELGSATPEDERTVVEVIRHPDFYSGGLYNDIAILILNEPYAFTQFGPPINEICLPPESRNFDNEICIAAGWNNKEKSSLKKVVLPVVPREKCETSLRSTTLGARFNLHSSSICAGGVQGQDACLGDGGSPLMCGIDGVHYLAGMVSWGKGCGQSNVPGVYTDVSQFRGWIKEELKKHNLDVVI